VSIAWPVSVGAILYRGYDIPTLCQSLAKLGVKYVDLDFIEPPPAFRGRGYGAHVTESDLTRPQWFRKVLADYGLEAVTFSGHMFLISTSEVELFMRKMEFAKAIGARYIATNHGPKGEETRLLRNLETILERAKDLDIVVCLENSAPGTIIQSGQDARSIFERVPSPYLGFTYDFGNAYHSHRGQIDFIEDLQNVLPFLQVLHFKDVQLEEGVLQYCAIGQGIVDFRGIVSFLKSCGRTFPVTLEIPYFFRSTNWGPFETLEDTKPLPEIEGIVQVSLSFVETLWEGSSGEGSKGCGSSGG